MEIKKLLQFTLLCVVLLGTAFMWFSPDFAKLVCRAYDVLIVSVIGTGAVWWAWSAGKLKGILILVAGSAAVLGVLFVGLRLAGLWLDSSPIECLVTCSIACFFIGGLIGSRIEADECHK